MFSVDAEMRSLLVSLFSTNMRAIGCSLRFLSIGSSALVRLLNWERLGQPGLEPGPDGLWVRSTRATSQQLTTRNHSGKPAFRATVNYRAFLYVSGPQKLSYHAATFELFGISEWLQVSSSF